MYTCKAKRQNPIGLFISAGLFTLTLFFIAKSIQSGNSVMSPYATVALLLFILAVLIASRFVFSSFEYSYDPTSDTFTVREIRYKSSSVKARLVSHEIESIIKIERRKDKKILKRKIDHRSFDYRPDLFPKRYQVITSSSPDLCISCDEIRLLVSLDDRMISILTQLTQHKNDSFFDL